MKRFTFLTFLTAAFLFSVLVITSCTKEGPAGKDGVDGAVGLTGPRGEAGVDGTDGTAGCILCHTGGTEQGMFAQVNQWEHSIHALGGNFERNTGDCATCHTSQGFLANLAGTYDGVGISNPNPINCYTCHNIHKTFTPADLGFTATAGVELMVGGDVFDFGKGNLCANCHQARSLAADLVIDGPDVVVGSRYGGHHGPQANILAGSGLFEFGGSATISPNTHQAVENGCVTCHMADAYGTQAGGHSMGMTYEYHSALAVWPAGCLECHTSADDLHADVEAVQEEVEELMAELQAALNTAGIMSGATQKTGTFPANIAAAYVNYQLIEEDRSKGVHNPKYVIGILKNTIAKITP